MFWLEYVYFFFLLLRSFPISTRCSFLPSVGPPLAADPNPCPALTTQALPSANDLSPAQRRLISSFSAPISLLSLWLGFMLMGSIFILMNELDMAKRVRKFWPNLNPIFLTRSKNELTRNPTRFFCGSTRPDQNNPWPDPLKNSQNFFFFFLITSWYFMHKYQN